MAVLEVRDLEVSFGDIRILRGISFDLEAGQTLGVVGESGVWEKIAGEGPDVMAGTREDVEAVKAEKAAAKKVIDLDKSE